MTVSAVNRGPITLGVMLAAILGALDTTIVNVALPNMQASLSASPEQITWVITSYIVASAVTIPVTGWLSARIGIKPLLLISVAGFTVASALCGLATSLPEMVLFRILQGMLAAPMMPLGQAVLLNINPPERFGRAMALFTMAAVVAPVVGPVFGGFLTDNFSWRWCFFINLPGGVAALLMLWIFMPRETPAPRRFDFLGYASLALAIAAFQLMLDRGPSQDWFSSPEVWAEALVALGAFWVFVTHTVTAKNPLFDRALARDRNFVTTNIFGFFFSFIAFCSLTLLPIMMQGVLGYSVLHAGMLSMPRGLAMLLVLQIIGPLDAKVDRRLLVGFGMCLVVFSFWQMSQFDLSMTGREIVVASVFQGIGQGIMFVPLATLSFATISPELRADASVLSNLIRNLGGSAGIASMQALTQVNSQSAHAALGAHVQPQDPLVRWGLPPWMSPDTTAGALALDAEINRQAAMLAYVTDFRLLVILGLLTLPLVLVLRSPRRTGADRAVVIESH